MALCSGMPYVLGGKMKNSKKTQHAPIMPDREQLIRAVVTSTAVETGQESGRLADALKDKRERYAHLRLAV